MLDVNGLHDFIDTGVRTLFMLLAVWKGIGRVYGGCPKQRLSQLGKQGVIHTHCPKQILSQLGQRDTNIT